MRQASVAANRIINAVAVLMVQAPSYAPIISRPHWLLPFPSLRRTHAIEHERRCPIGVVINNSASSAIAGCQVAAHPCPTPAFTISRIHTNGSRALYPSSLHQFEPVDRHREEDQRIIASLIDAHLQKGRIESHHAVVHPSTARRGGTSVTERLGAEFQAIALCYAPGIPCGRPLIFSRSLNIR